MPSQIIRVRDRYYGYPTEIREIVSCDERAVSTHLGSNRSSCDRLGWSVAGSGSDRYGTQHDRSRIVRAEEARTAAGVGARTCAPPWRGAQAANRAAAQAFERA